MHFTMDGTPYVMGLVTDITLRHRAEVELQRTNQELEDRVEQRTAQLREAERSVRDALEKERELHTLKSRFVAMASHEFRTPLSTIMSSVDLISRYTEREGDERVAKHIARIRGKVREMTSMLNEFLSLERIDQGEVICQPAETDVVHLCIELIEELRAQTKTGQSIARIAADLGYADTSAFYRAFTGWTGMSPERYRRQLAGQSHEKRGDPS